MPSPVPQILVGIDFSEYARRAACVAASYARPLGAPLVLAHVTAWFEGMDTAKALLAREAQTCPLPPASTVLLSGHPADELARFARREPVAFIVVGTHGRTGFRRALLGSVAESLPRIAPCPVLVVPPPRLMASMPLLSEPAAAARCLVCSGPMSADERICEPCRARIRGEAISGRR